MKIRLYRGPFDGKVLEHSRAGSYEIRLTGPKPMTRKQRYEWERERYMNGPFNYLLDSSGRMSRNFDGFPQVEATYRICVGYGNIPLKHPDGSIFYEWSKPRR